MAKGKRAYVCNACGSQFSQWGGQCTQCFAWNSLAEESNIVVNPSRGLRRGYAAEGGARQPQRLADIEILQHSRIPTGLSELDRVLGSGLVQGSVVLIGGDPGIGKSTLLLQTLVHIQKQHSVLYITGEESLQQVRLRADRLGLEAADMKLHSETCIELILEIAHALKPTVMVIDSIQTMYTENLSSAPGGVGQVRESAGQLVQFAKQSGTAVFLVGHVTKEGALAGPRVLEHMVDAVLYFEGERDNRFRLIRAVKNRFGAVNELGVFAMTDKGLREINNPSRIFLSREGAEVPGSVVLVTWEGSRPLLVEVQALVADSHMPNPRRVTVGLDQNRLAMLLAVLHRHGGIATYDQDVFVNVVGGVRVTETGSDLSLILAVLSSLRDKPLSKELIVFGEIGLAGEIRPVQSGLERLREAAKLGFKQAIIPKGNAPKKPIPDIEIIAVQNIQEALSAVLSR